MLILIRITSRSSMCVPPLHSILSKTHTIQSTLIRCKCVNNVQVAKIQIIQWKINAKTSSGYIVLRLNLLPHCHQQNHHFKIEWKMECIVMKIEVQLGSVRINCKFSTIILFKLQQSTPLIYCCRRRRRRHHHHSEIQIQIQKCDS